MSFFLEIYYFKALFWALWLVWLVCHCCFFPKPVTHNVDVYQQESSLCFVYLYVFRISEDNWYLSLCRIPFALFNFCFKKLMGSLKGKGSSSKTPRYLVQVFRLIFCPLKWKFIFLVICFLGDRKIMISFLLTFKAILFARIH